MPVEPSPLAETWLLLVSDRLVAEIAVLPSPVDKMAPPLLIAAGPSTAMAHACELTPIERTRGRSSTGDGEPATLDAGRPRSSPSVPAELTSPPSAITNVAFEDSATASTTPGTPVSNLETAPPRQHMRSPATRAHRMVPLLATQTLSAPAMPATGVGVLRVVSQQRTLPSVVTAHVPSPPAATSMTAWTAATVRGPVLGSDASTLGASARALPQQRSD